MMTAILGILAYFIIGGIVLGIITMINDDIHDTGNIVIIGMLWPITVIILITTSIIEIVDTLINIIDGLFIKNKKH